MPATVLDDWKVLPRLMMLAVTILTYQAVHWFMGLPDPSVAQSGRKTSICVHGSSDWLFWHMDG